MKTFTCLKLFLFSIFAVISVSNVVLANDERIVHTINFSNVQEGDAKKWLVDQGYALKLEAKYLDMQFNLCGGYDMPSYPSSNSCAPLYSADSF